MNTQEPVGDNGQIVYGQPVTPEGEMSYMKRSMLRIFGLGVAEVVIGFLSVLLGIESLFIAIENQGYYSYSEGSGSIKYNLYYHGFTYSSQGVWCGIVVIVTGFLAVKLKSNPSECMYKANMGMSLVAAELMGMLFILSGKASQATDSSLPDLIAVHSRLNLLGFVGAVICLVHFVYSRASVLNLRRRYQTAVLLSPQQVIVQQPQAVQLPDGQYVIATTRVMCTPTPAFDGTVRPPFNAITPTQELASEEIQVYPNYAAVDSTTIVNSQNTSLYPPRAAVHATIEQQVQMQKSEDSPPGYSTLPRNEGT